MSADGTPCAAGTQASVVLVGFMGVGKSRVGKAVARRRGVPFVDCDHVIEHEAGPIPGIFASAGEVGFRAIEQEVVLRVLAEAGEQPRVVALGGGAVLSGDVREALTRFAHVVWLTAPLEDVWRRVGSGARADRPLAGDEAAFRRLFEERVALYERVATCRVANGDGRNVADVVDDIVGALTGSAQAEGAA